MNRNNSFAQLVNQTARGLYAKNLETFAPPLQQYILSQSVLETMSGMFGDSEMERLAAGAVRTAQEQQQMTLPRCAHTYQDIFDYSPALQPELFQLQSNALRADWRGQREYADACRLSKEQIMHYLDVISALPTSQGERDGLEKLLCAVARSGGAKQFELLYSSLAQFGKKRRSAGSRYVLWLSEHSETTCKTCNGRGGMLFNIEEEPKKPHPNCKCKKIYFDGGAGTDKPKQYLIAIFAGIDMLEGNQEMQDLASLLRLRLKDRNQNHVVKTMTFAPYDNTKDEIDWNDGKPGDIIQVVYRAYLPQTISVSNYASQIEAEYLHGTYQYDSVILIGFSGGGVMVTRIAEELQNRGSNIPIDSIIRIGSPELYVNIFSALKNTHDIIMPGDPVPVIFFIRTLTEFPAPNQIMLDMEYDTLNPFAIHLLYFSHLEDEKGISNIEKTVQTVLHYIE